MDRPRPSDRRVRRRVRHRHLAAGATRACPPRRACSSAAARRRCSRPSSSCASSTRSSAADDAEVTVECNPDSVDAAKLDAYRRGRGQPAELRRAVDGAARARRARAHARSRERARAPSRSRATPASSASTSTSSTARPASRPTTGERSLDGALALGVEHVSAYALTVEPATPLGRQVAAGAPAPDDDVQADAYLRADAVLAAAGLEWYEVSNWARPGEECRHNLLYWTGGEYVGDRLRRARPHRRAPVVERAHARALHRRDRRRDVRRSPARRRSTPTTRAEEAFALALRTRRGRAGRRDRGRAASSTSSPRQGLVRAGRATGSC